MTVAYFIFSDKKGMGGHYRSLKETYLSISKKDGIETCLFNIGENPSPVISGLNNFEFFRAYLLALPVIIIRLYIKLRAKKVDVLHAYDSYAYFYVRILSFLLGKPSFYTKCGGPNSSYTPFCKDTILFSSENLTYLQSKNLSGSRNLHLIPNRITIPVQNSDKIALLKEKHGLSGKKVILRICRIDPYYEKSILQAVSLANHLNESAPVYDVLVVGAVYNQIFFSTLKAELPANVKFETEPLFYTEASAIIDVADIVVGTGRGIMEAMALKKSVFCPVQNASVAVKVTPDNFMSFLDFNFSERSVVEDSVVNDNEPPEQIIEQNFLLFEEHLEVENGTNKILKLYQSNQSRSYYFNDFVKNFLTLAYRTFPYRSSLKSLLK